MLDQVTQLVAILAAISVADERIVELLKGYIPWIATTSTNPTHESWRRASIQLLAAAVGTVLAWQMKGQLAALLPTGPWVYVVFGLMSSGGSGLWNHLLDIVRATKVNKELQVSASAADAPAAKAAAAAKA